MKESNQNPLVIGTDTVVYHESSEEFSLPDYVPEIRKVLCVSCGVVPESKYVSEGSECAQVEFGGSITYSLIYTDEEGKLSALPLNSNYEAKGQIASMPRGTIIDTIADNATCRVNGPRRVTLKSRLKSRILSFVQAETEGTISPKSSADELYVERLTATYPAMQESFHSLEGIKISESFEKGGKPLWCDAQGIINDVKAQRGSVSVKGEVTIRCLVNRNGKIEVIEKNVPVYELIECEGAENEDTAQANIRCVSLSISNEETNNSEKLFFDLECEIECQVFKSIDIEITKDAYSTKNEMEVTYEKRKLNTLLRASNSSFTLSEGVKRKNKDIADVIQVIGDPVVEKTEIKGAKCIILGKLNATVIGSRDLENAESEYLSEACEIPFKYELDLGKESKNVTVRALPCCLGVNARLEKDTIYVNGEINMGVTAYEQYEIEMLKKGEIIKEKEVKKDTSSVKIYFPKDSDTLWEIAKAYHTRVSILCKENGIEPSSNLNDIKLIIE